MFLYLMRYKHAVPQPWADMDMRVTVAPTYASATIAAETVIALNAGHQPGALDSCTGS